MAYKGEWKEHEREIIQRDWSTPKLTSDIARELGRSADAIRMQALKMGLKRPVVTPKGNGKWDNEEGKLLLARMEHLLVVERRTVAEAAQILSAETKRHISRNVIIGLSDRRGFARAKTSTRPATPGTRKVAAPKIPRQGKDNPSRSNAQNVRQARAKAITQAQAPKPIPSMENGHREPTAYRPEAWEPIVGSFPQTLAKLGSTCCKWPVGGSGADMLFCCEPARTDLEPYCSEHARRSYADTSSAKELRRGLRHYL